MIDDNSFITAKVAEQSYATRLVNAISSKITSINADLMDNLSSSMKLKRAVGKLVPPVLESAKDTAAADLIELAHTRQEMLIKALRKAVPNVVPSITETNGGYKLVLKIAGQEIAYLTYGFDWSGSFAEVMHVFVDEKFRRFGLATEMFKYASAKLADAGYAGLISPPSARLEDGSALLKQMEESGLADGDGHIVPQQGWGADTAFTDALYQFKMLSDDRIKDIVSKDPLKMGDGVAFTLDEVFEELLKDKVSTFERALKLGIIENKSNAELITMLSGTKANEFKDGLLSGERRHIESLVRTATNSVSNQISNEFFKTNGDILKGLQWTATLDGRTSPVCRARDGQLFPVDEGPRPPAHIRCRSYMVPVLKSWEDAGLPFDDLPPSTRASMDGQVPETLSYDDWLKTKSPEFVKGVLGPTRADMYLSGKLSMSDFVNDDGHELTIDQLKKLL